MRKKLSLVLVVIFLLVLTNCSLFDGPTPVHINEPQENAILVQGGDFWVSADIIPEYSMGSVSVVLSSLSEENPYDSILWVFAFDEGLNVENKFEIEKEFTVPSDAPAYDYYLLRVNIWYGGGGIGYAGAVPVSVFYPID